MSDRKTPGFWGERLGLLGIRRRLLDRSLPAEVGWLHTLGSVTLVLILVLVASGVLLSLNYAPATEHAYGSVRFIETQVVLGSLTRGLHHWATTLLVIAITFHLLHTLATLAFRRPREVTWVTGVLLLAVVLAFSFTGYLLPWDEKAYWATVVGTSMVEQFPLLGEFLLHVVRGGAEVGAATLSRFYGTHVAVLPILLTLLLATHLYLVVYHGIASDRAAEAGQSERNVPFWPDVLAMDTAAALLTLGLLFFLALGLGAPLGAPADPTNAEYAPRPEWYFLPLFQLLTYFPGEAEALAVVAIPLGFGMLVALLPWWSRPLLRRRWGRPTLLAGSGIATALVVALGAAAATGPELAPPAPEVARGRQLYDQLGCVACHTIRGVGGVIGPDLTLIGLRPADQTWLADHLREPAAVVPGSPMPAFPLAGERLSDLVAYLGSLGNDLRHTPEAQRLFRSRCQPCHQLAGPGGVFGPDLVAIGRVRTVAYIHDYAEQPTAYNRFAHMPPVVGLTHRQIEDVARYVVATALAQPEPSPEAPAEAAPEER